MAGEPYFISCYPNGAIMYLNDVIYTGDDSLRVSDCTLPDPIVGWYYSGMPQRMEYDDHTFIEWNTSSDGSGTTYQVGDSFTYTGTGLTVYAIWEPDSGGGVAT